MRLYPQNHSAHHHLECFIAIYNTYIISGSLLNFGLELTEESLSKQNSGIMFNKRPLPTIIEDKSKCALSLQATRRRSFAQRPLQRESVNSDTSHSANRGLEQAAGSSSVASYQTPSHSVTRIATRAATASGDKRVKSREVECLCL